MEVVAEDILEMHVTHIGTLTDVGMRMRIRGSKGCNDHNDCRDRMIRGGRACRGRWIRGCKACNDHRGNGRCAG